jgi:hypothetical protein
MKKTLFFLTSLIALLFASCTSVYYYQVYKVNPDNKIVIGENSLTYEDDNCKVSYDLWDENGHMGFVFYNKTNNNIYLNKEESFYIFNGIAHQYFQNRTFTSSKNIGISASKGASASTAMTGINYLDLIQTNKNSIISSVGAISSSGYSVSYTEEKNICIPSKAAKIIFEYSINDEIIRDCDLFKYPTKKQIKSISFAETNSPLKFSNRIVYSIDKSGEQILFENQFFVSEITNYPESEFIVMKYDEYCGQKGTSLIKYFKDVSPDKFYVKYTKGVDGWKH